VHPSLLSQVLAGARTLTPEQDFELCEHLGLSELERDVFESLHMGTQRTFLSKTSPFITNHHTNWRLRAIETSKNLSDQELMFSFPMSISEKDFARIREMFAEIISKSSLIIKDSPSERVACMNIDLFWVK
jgi:hypothetical protein